MHMPRAKKNMFFFSFSFSLPIKEKMPFWGRKSRLPSSTTSALLRSSAFEMTRTPYALVALGAGRHAC